MVAAKGTITLIDTAKLSFQITCDANGEFDLNVTEGGAATWYVVLVLGDECYVSPALTFAA